MPRKEGSFIQIDFAKLKLESLGYHIIYEKENNVITVEKDGKRENCLIHTRTYDSTGRYLVGIRV